MRGHRAQMWMCAGMIVVALGLVLITGNPLAFIPVVGCVLMMVVTLPVAVSQAGAGGAPMLRHCLS